MKKVTKLILMLGLIFSGAFCYAHSVAKTENGKEQTIPLEVKNSVLHGSSDKSGSIVPTLNGHVLTIVFTENLGQVAVEITTATGVPVENLWTYTPNGIQTYLSLCGDYIVNFTLPNGDEYYGEFTVTD